MRRDDIVAHLERYAAGFGAPVQEGVEVTALRPRDSHGFVLETSAGQLEPDAVVLTTGAYQRPNRPPPAAALPPGLLQIDVVDYREPGELPDGQVLVVGSGQSGCQIAEELHLAGREVYLACGRAPWASRRIGERDIVWWVRETGDFDDTLSSLPSPAARLAANVQASGHGGGHDLHYRTLQRMGVTLLGHFVGVEGHHARFAPDLAASVAWGDHKNVEFMGRIRKTAAERGLPPPEIPDPAPFSAGEPPEHLDLTGFGAVVFTGGFRPDYSSWVHCPDAFDDMGFPIHEDCASAVTPGLYFAGVHFLRKRKSSLLIGVGEDAALAARGLSRRAR
jgi:putative flavoprotein involved in K+ transport